MFLPVINYDVKKLEDFLCFVRFQVDVVHNNVFLKIQYQCILNKKNDMLLSHYFFRLNIVYLKIDDSDHV